MTRTTALSLIAALVTNLAIRSVELLLAPVTSYFTEWRSLLSHPWLALLPIEIGGGYTRWTTSGLVVLAPLESLLGVEGAFLLMNALLVGGGFGAAWWGTRSARFSLTVAWCFALTTQFHWAYRIGAVTIFYLGALYAVWNMAALARIVVPSAFAGRVSAKPVFLLSLFLLALWWEQWLDYWLAAMVVCGFLWWVSRRLPSTPVDRAGVVYAIKWLGATIAAYLLIKLQYSGEHVVLGKESEIITNYLIRDGLPLSGGLTLAYEDALSNALTYTYLALTNYLPPLLLPGRSLDMLGPDAIIASQHGYHLAMQPLVRYHHVFFWYFYAGAIAAAFGAFTWKLIRRSLRAGEPAVLAGTSLVILVWLGSATHWLIKYRPYLSEPLLHYKALLSIVGVTGLIALGVTILSVRLDQKSRRALFAAGLAMLISGAVFRPASLSAMSERLQMGPLPVLWTDTSVRALALAWHEIQAAADAIRCRVGLAPSPPTPTR